MAKKEKYKAVANSDYGHDATESYGWAAGGYAMPKARAMGLSGSDFGRAVAAAGLAGSAGVAGKILDRHRREREPEEPLTEAELELLRGSNSAAANEAGSSAARNEAGSLLVKKSFERAQRVFQKFPRNGRKTPSTPQQHIQHEKKQLEVEIDDIKHQIEILTDMLQDAMAKLQVFELAETALTASSITHTITNQEI